MRGTLFIVAAPSGAGKSSIVNACLARDPDMRLSISFTSRPPRPGERDGEHYHFVGEAEFQRMIAAGEFLFEQIREVFRKLTPERAHAGVDIVAAELGNNAGVVGAELDAGFPDQVAHLVAAWERERCMVDT